MGDECELFAEVETDGEMGIIRKCALVQSFNASLATLGMLMELVDVLEARVTPVNGHGAQMYG